MSSFRADIIFYQNDEKLSAATICFNPMDATINFSFRYQSKSWIQIKCDNQFPWIFSRQSHIFKQNRLLKSLVFKNVITFDWYGSNSNVSCLLSNENGLFIGCLSCLMNISLNIDFGFQISTKNISIEVAPSAKYSNPIPSMQFDSSHFYKINENLKLGLMLHINSSRRK